MKLEPVIGLEVHAELLTQSKMFCGCKVVDSTGIHTNCYVCPICTGQPGALPTVNRRAVEFAIQVGLALNCKIQPVTAFARKNYYYPDLPKGFQISQHETPLGINGWMRIDTLEGTKTIRVRRVHLEEDTGKLSHTQSYALVDFNRSGVPLLEIVSEPDLHSVEDVKLYATNLRTLLRYLDVNTGDMEKGVIRFEANVSMREIGTSKLNTRTEIKNLNSFRALVRACEYELARQQREYSGGRIIDQETLGWDDQKNETYSQRGKEHAHDYRYFPEPDIPPILIDSAWVDSIRASLVELPNSRRERFLKIGLSAYLIELLLADRKVADYFDIVLNLGHKYRISPKSIATWISTELFAQLNESGQTIDVCKVTPEKLVELLDMINKGTINITMAKAVLREMFASGQSAIALVKSMGWTQIKDDESIIAAVEQVISENPEQIKRYFLGKAAIFNWFIGQIMQITAGKASTDLVAKHLKRKLSDLKSTLSK